MKLRRFSVLGGKRFSPEEIEKLREVYSQSVTMEEKLKSVRELVKNTNTFIVK